MKTQNIIIGAVAVAAIGALVYFGGAGKTIEQKRQALLDLGESTAFNQMTDQEIKDSYDLVFEYTMKGKTVPAGDFRNRIMIIGKKYNIFT